MSKELDDLRAERDQARKQAEVWKHRVERTEQRIKYQRSAKDRKCKRWFCRVWYTIRKKGSRVLSLSER